MSKDKFGCSPLDLFEDVDILRRPGSPNLDSRLQLQPHEGSEDFGEAVSLRNYSEFFSTLVGFFLIDDYLRHTMPGAVSSYQIYLSDQSSLRIYP
ncbi:unnamed protein product [Schistocephalus solidus]|uniref:Uncharacterized protein n=1 Tax=Schistocephalus solidus TaxID=70667 RepID=A0A183TDZ3_SCHSO|nr:unnamed protein product [Schistocephalus solidus]